MYWVPFFTYLFWSKHPADWRGSILQCLVDKIVWLAFLNTAFGTVYSLIYNMQYGSLIINFPAVHVWVVILPFSSLFCLSKDTELTDRASGTCFHIYILRQSMHVALCIQRLVLNITHFTHYSVFSPEDESRLVSKHCKCLYLVTMEKVLVHTRDEKQYTSIFTLFRSYSFCLYSTSSNMRVNLSCKDRPDHPTNMSRIFSWTTGKSKT